MATYTVTVQQDNLAEGAEVEIPGLGVFVNGSTSTLTDEQVATFRQLHTTYVQDYDDDGNPVGEPVYTPGPTPDRGINTFGVSIEVTEEKKQTPLPPQTPASTTPTAGGVPLTTDGGSI